MHNKPSLAVTRPFKTLLASATILSVGLLALNYKQVVAGITTVNGSSGNVITLTATSARVGDVKHGYQTGDHDGWVELNGRAASGNLTVGQTTQAVALGLLVSGNLPDARDRSIVGVSGTKPVNNSGGTASATILQANLPNVSLNSSSVSGGTPSVSISSDSAGTPSGNIVGASAGTPTGGISSDSAGTPVGTVASNGAHTHPATVTFHDATGGGFNGGRIQSTDRNPFRSQANASEVAIQSAGAHTHPFTGNALSGHSHTYTGNVMPAHTHAFSGSSLSAHTHTASSSALPGHTHTTSLGGSGVAVNTQNPYIAIRTFVYLGT